MKRRMNYVRTFDRDTCREEIIDRRRREDNIKMDLQDITCEDADWTHLAQEMN
jgi:hypothetical protein